MRIFSITDLQINSQFTIYLRELSKIMADHFRLDFNLVEDLTVVDGKNGTDHLRDNNHVTEVSFDGSGLLASDGLLLGSTELLDKTHGLALQTALESSAST